MTNVTTLEGGGGDMTINDFKCPACGKPGEFELLSATPVRYITIMYKDGELLMERQGDNELMGTEVGDWHCLACGHKIIRGSKYAFTEYMLKRLCPGGSHAQ